MDLEEKPKIKIKDGDLIEIDDDNEKLEFMIVNKTPLKNIIKSDELNNKINLTIQIVNKIVIQACQFITPFSVKSGTPRTPKKRNCTHKSVIILDPINYQLLIICLVNFISVGLLSFIKLKDLLYLKGLSLNFM